MKTSLNGLWLKMLRPSQYFQTLEMRVASIEQELEVLQAKVEDIESNALLIMGFAAIVKFEDEMNRLEKIFNSSSDQLFPSSWRWLNDYPNERMRLANGF